jgi:hypothetical protein
MNDQDRTNGDPGDAATDRFDAGVAKVARETYNSPPETPRDEMWAVIQAARNTVPGRDDDAVIPLRRFRPQPWWAAVAAALVIGVALGRGSLGGGPDEGTAVADGGAQTPIESTADASVVPRSYRVAAARHLTRTENFLTMFRVDARSEQLDGELGTWARRLLTDTRLLLDSPAGRDPDLRVLLGDLELVLAQIVQLRDADPEGVEIIDEGLESSQLLFRLKAAQAVAPAAVGL